MILHFEINYASLLFTNQRSSNLSSAGLLKSSINSSSLPMADLFWVEPAILALGAPIAELLSCSVTRPTEASPSTEGLGLAFDVKWELRGCWDGSLVNWDSSLMFPLMFCPSPPFLGFAEVSCVTPMCWGKLRIWNGELSSCMAIDNFLLESSKSLKIFSVSKRSMEFFCSISSWTRLSLSSCSSTDVLATLGGE